MINSLCSTHHDLVIVLSIYLRYEWSKQRQTTLVDIQSLQWEDLDLWYNRAYIPQYVRVQFQHFVVHCRDMPRAFQV